MERANELWQIDGTDWELADGEPVKIIDVIDDGSRLCAASRAHQRETLAAAWDTFLAGAAQWGMPEAFLSDNGTGLRAMDAPLAKLGIRAGHSKPYRPQTCGKVERFHQTLKKWLRARPTAESITELQDQLDDFRHIYNHERPHRAISRTCPAQRWNEMAKSGPKDRPLDLGAQRIGNRTVNPNGIVKFANKRITVGKAHAGTTATVITSANHAHIFIGTELIRELPIDPTIKHYPLYDKPGRPRP